MKLNNIHKCSLRFISDLPKRMTVCLKVVASSEGRPNISCENFLVTHLILDLGDSPIVAPVERLRQVSGDILC